MQEVLEASRPGLSQAPSPLSISDSGRRASLRTALPSRNTDSGGASSPRTRLSRKMAASLELGTADHPRLDDLTLDNAGSAPVTADPTREQVCLCQPDPKIPRPRNGTLSPLSFISVVMIGPGGVLEYSVSLYNCPKGPFRSL
jgi:HMG box factor